MLPRITDIKICGDYVLEVSFDDGICVSYDVKDDIKTIPVFKELETQIGLFSAFTVDESRTCISWTDQIDLPSDTIKEYGVPIEK